MMFTSVIGVEVLNEVANINKKVDRIVLELVGREVGVCYDFTQFSQTSPPQLSPKRSSTKTSNNPNLTKTTYNLHTKNIK